MKQIFKLLTGIIVLAVSFSACKKDENKITFEGGTAPVLSANKSTSIPLSFANKDLEAVKLTWTNPDYKFTTGVSSQDVNYKIEIDKAGANFATGALFPFVVSKDLNKVFTQAELNDFLTNRLALPTATSANIQIRVTSYLATGAVPLTSNVLAFQVVPYAPPPKVTPPAELFIVGSATPGSWNNPVPTPSQKFTMVSPTLFEITIPITPGGSYLFLPVNGSWNAKFGCLGANNTNNVNGDDFKANGGDMLAPSVAGNYKIVVNFQSGVFTLTKL